MSGQSDGTSFDRTVLPPPDPSFEGEIEVAFKDSRADWPEPLRAPQGAPNVLLIMGDDIGYGHMSAFGGPARRFDRLAQQGLRFTKRGLQLRIDSWAFSLQRTSRSRRVGL